MSIRHGQNLLFFLFMIYSSCAQNRKQKLKQLMLQKYVIRYHLAMKGLLMKRKFAIMLACLMLVGSLAGCSSPTPTTTAPATKAPETAPVTTKAATQAPETTPADTSITITDQGGNTVTLEKPAERIVTCFYGQTYAMIALGLQDRLIAIEHNAAKRPIYGKAAPELIDLPDVGSLKEFNVEAALAMNPDVMLLPKKLKDTASAFEAVGIPVVICYPESCELLEEQLMMIATICGMPERAEALISYYNDTFAKLAELTGSLAEADKPVVYMGSVSSYLSTAPKTMYQASLITNAGGINAAQDVDGDYWTDISYEQLLAMNPDYIILPSEAKYTPEDVLGDEQLSELKAVKEGKVFAMPNAFEAWDSPVPSGILGSLWLLAILHGDRYSMDEMRAEAVSFYQTFYGFEADASLIQ